MERSSGQSLIHKTLAAQTTIDRRLPSLVSSIFGKLFPFSAIIVRLIFFRNVLWDLRMESLSQGQSYCYGATHGPKLFNKLEQSKASMWKSHHSSISPSNHALQILQIPSYSLTVRATDNGHPAQFSDVAVRVHVSDVNDNPPRFFQLNYSVVVQVSQEAVCSPSPSQGTKILMHGPLLEQRGEAAMKHAVALCSLPQRNGGICRADILQQMPLSLSNSFRHLLSFQYRERRAFHTSQAWPATHFSFAIIHVYATT